jgi:hypothetical protein
MAQKAKIKVERVEDGDPFRFHVEVTDGEGASRHEVTLNRELHEEITGGEHEPEEVVEAAFRFLLDRESKGAILARFDVSEIDRYFPGFEEQIGQYLIGAF